jgi:ABC-2 type transport system ATP-binding protein
MVELAISAQHVVKKYAQAKSNAVDDISLEVESGEIYGFLGPNGAGKSTAIKVFVTTLFPTSGKVSIFGADTLTQTRQVREQIGVVYQNTSLDENLTAEENLRSQAVLYGLTPFALAYRFTSKVYQQRVDELLTLLELQDVKFEIVKKFSGGMKRKLDIAKSLLSLPKILFLDEPTTGLDPQSRKAIWEYLLQFQRKHGFTIFLTTQYLEEAEVCDRISIIDHGKILVTDTPNNLKKKVGDELLYLRPSNAGALKKELTQLKLEFSETKNHEVVVEIKTAKAQQILQKIKTELLEISIKKPTLDDAFIQLTGHQIRQ